MFNAAPALFAAASRELAKRPGCCWGNLHPAAAGRSLAAWRWWRWEGDGGKVAGMMNFVAHPAPRCPMLPTFNRQCQCLPWGMDMQLQGYSRLLHHRSSKMQLGWLVLMYMLLCLPLLSWLLPTPFEPHIQLVLLQRLQHLSLLLLLLLLRVVQCIRGGSISHLDGDKDRKGTKIDDPCMGAIGFLRMGCTCGQGQQGGGRVDIGGDGRGLLDRRHPAGSRGGRGCRSRDGLDKDRVDRRGLNDDLLRGGIQVLQVVVLNLLSVGQDGPQRASRGLRCPRHKPQRALIVRVRPGGGYWLLLLQLLHRLMLRLFLVC